MAGVLDSEGQWRQERDCLPLTNSMQFAKLLSMTVAMLPGVVFVRTVIYVEFSIARDTKELPSTLPTFNIAKHSRRTCQTILKLLT